MTHLPWLDPYNDNQPFPDPRFALREPDGLLAIGGNLSPTRLLNAYRNGIFPWYSAGQPILWWSPDPRMVLFPERLKISRSLRKILRKQLFSITMDTAFDPVIAACSERRGDESGTWITPAMRSAYNRLYRLGYVHSVETWWQGELAGGLYGVALGGVYFGESMFSRVSNASKVALVGLAEQLRRWEFAVIDCQMHTSHLLSLGAEDIPRKQFIELLDRSCSLPPPPGERWHCDIDILNLAGSR